MQAPPALTPERIDAMLSIAAEVCLESVVEAGQRQKAAEDDEAFERCGRSLQVACRNLRQTIAMKQRFDREEAQKAADARKLDAETRQEAAREREAAASRRRAQLRVRLHHDIWNEYEPEEADDLCDDLDARLRDLSAEDDFLDAPFDTVLLRLTQTLGLGQDQDEPGEQEAPPPPPAAVPLPRRGRRAEASAAETDAAADPATLLTPRGRGTMRSMVEGDQDELSAGIEAPKEPPELEAAPEPPPEPPPPDPEPYIPPWEKLRPGQIIHGGSGW